MTIKQIYDQFHPEISMEYEDTLLRAIGLRVQNILDSFPNRSFININDLLHYEFGVEEPEWYIQQDFKEMKAEYNNWNPGEEHDEASS